MRLSAEIINILNVYIIMVVFSFLAFVGYSSDKKITNIRKEKPFTISSTATERQYARFSLNLLKTNCYP